LKGIATCGETPIPLEFALRLGKVFLKKPGVSFIPSDLIESSHSGFFHRAACSNLGTLTRAFREWLAAMPSL